MGGCGDCGWHVAAGCAGTVLAERGRRGPMGVAGPWLGGCCAEAATWRPAVGAERGACAVDPRHGADHPRHYAGRFLRRWAQQGICASTAGQLDGQQVCRTAFQSAYRTTYRLACQRLDQMKLRPRLATLFPFRFPMVGHFGEPYTSEAKDPLRVPNHTTDHPTLWPAACRHTANRMTGQLTVWRSYLPPDRPAHRLPDLLFCWLGSRPVGIPATRLAGFFVWWLVASAVCFPVGCLAARFFACLAARLPRYPVAYFVGRLAAIIVGSPVGLVAVRTARWPERIVARRHAKQPPYCPVGLPTFLPPLHPAVFLSFRFVVCPTGRPFVLLAVLLAVLPAVFLVGRSSVQMHMLPACVPDFCMSSRPSSCPCEWPPVLSAFRLASPLTGSPSAWMGALPSSGPLWRRVSLPTYCAACRTDCLLACRPTSCPTCRISCRLTFWFVRLSAACPLDWPTVCPTFLPS